MEFFRFKIVYIISIILSLNQYLYAQNIDIEKAKIIFQEYEEICKKDDGSLWGRSLFGPLMLVNRENRSLIANTPDINNDFNQTGNMYQGRIPEEMGIANTTFNWKGTQWTMVMWPLNENIYLRNQLIFHESFHSLQNKMGMEIPNTENPHLDLLDGRIYLQLEWLALLSANNSIDKVDHIKNALIFRNYRRSLFEKSDSTENALELLEGIAEYTGIKLSGRDTMETILYLSDMVDEARNRPSFFRTFPYTSGPLYCFLLDEIEPLWRENILEIKDLGEYLKMAYSISLPADLEKATQIAALKYDGDKIFREEKIIEEKNLAKKQSIINTFIEGPVIIIKPETPNMEFSPLNMMSIDEKGTYYKTFRLVDVWGILEANEGVFILNDWSAIHISAENLVVEDSVVSGMGWTLNLKRGWEISSCSDSSSNFILEDQN